MYSIELMDNNSEIVKYNVSNMPLKSCTSRQEDYPGLAVIDHWHTDFEFAYVTKGSMLYSVNGERCELRAGDMIMVNSGQLHHGFWEEVCECEFICTIFHPSILNKNIAGKYIDEIVGNKAVPFCVFSVNKPNERTITELIEDINDCVRRPFDGREIKIMSDIYRLVYLIYEHFKSCGANEFADKGKLDCLHKMVGFIQQNYSRKIFLDEIAKSGAVCRSTCCGIFRHFLGKTPMQYLNEYHISKSLDMLAEEDISITEISFACGFSGSSYFAEMFTRLMKCTPRKYRKSRR